MYRILYFLIAFWPFAGNAQDIRLKNFDAFSDGKYVRLNIVLEKGSVCNGIRIYRSLDSNYLQQVGFIDGICGSTDEPVGYTYIDSTPLLNKQAYYAVKPGSAPVTDVRSVFFTAAGAGALIYPNPARNSFTVVFNDDATEHGIRLYNISGVNVLQREGVFGAKTTVDTGMLPYGLYLYTILVDGEIVDKGKLVIM